MSEYRNTCGRLSVHLNDEGSRQHDYGYGVNISMRDAWNDQCLIQTFTMSVNDVRDLHYLTSRIIATAGDGA